MENTELKKEPAQLKFRIAILTATVASIDSRLNRLVKEVDPAVFNTKIRG